MNEFSAICRILGSLFYRQPQDPLLSPLMVLIQEGKLVASWPLEQDELLSRLQKSVDSVALAEDFQTLFTRPDCQVPPYRSAWQPEKNEQTVRQFLQQRGMPLTDAPADHFGGLLLAASWLEDHSQEDECESLIILFDEHILPWADGFLGKVEACATSAFYRTLAIITREALQAMRDELQESSENN